MPSGEQPTIQVSNIGYDANNNPIYSISLGIPNGEQGSPGVPITLVNGTIQTGAPGSNVSLTFTYSGENIAGQPIYRVDGSIPQGMPGSGNGNVQVTESGLVSGNQYVFVPNSDNTAIGTFQPITLPIQMQPDYAQVDSTATDYIKNKPNLSPNFVTSNAYTSTANGVSETVQVRSIQNGVGQPVTVQFPMVTDSQAGAMPASAFTQIQQNTSDINSLKSSGGKRWPSQATKAALDSYGVPSGGAQNDVITVRADESQGNATTQYVLIDSGSGLQWVFDYIVNSAPISIATESNLGLVKGSNIDGQQFTDVDGTLSTVGWDALKQRVTDVETELLTKGNSTAIFRRPSVGTVIYDGIDFYMTIYSSTEIRAHSKITTTISPEITQTRFEADNASTIKRSINISPSVSSVIGSVSTTTLVMDVIIGTNKEYIRITCQCTGVTSVLTQAQIIVEKLM